MNSKRSEKYPDWFLVLWDHGPWTMFVLAALFLGSLGAVAYYIDHRVGAIEDQLSFRPPELYKPPDLASLEATEAQLLELADEKHSPLLPQNETVYVPVYSHVYHQGGSPYLLEATLSIRNVDPTKPVFIESVRYYDTEGKLAKTHVEKPIRLGPLQTIEFLVKQHDVTGGSGANFLVDWRAAPATNPPLIETIMVGNVGPQAISFSSRGQTLNQQSTE